MSASAGQHQRKGTVDDVGGRTNLSHTPPRKRPIAYVERSLFAECRALSLMQVLSIAVLFATAPASTSASSSLSKSPGAASG